MPIGWKPRDLCHRENAISGSQKAPPGFGPGSPKCVQVVSLQVLHLPFKFGFSGQNRGNLEHPRFWFYSCISVMFKAVSTKLGRLVVFTVPHTSIKLQGRTSKVTWLIATSSSHFRVRWFPPPGIQLPGLSSLQFFLVSSFSHHFFSYFS